MYILGLHINGGQSSAALMLKGEILFAAAEERFSRDKQSKAFPKSAIDFCLREAKLESISKVDAIAISWNPSQNMMNINNSGFTSWRRYDPEWLYIVPNNLLDMDPTIDNNGDAIRLELGLSSNTPIYFVEHHFSHLAHAIFQSSFSEGMAAAIDEYSEVYSVTLATFDKNGISVFKRIDYPHSLGVFYAAITEFLGFKPNSDEWKVMGAAAYGNPKKFLEKLENILFWDPKEGEWLLDNRYIEHSNMKKAGYCNKRMEKLLGINKRNLNEKLCKAHFDLAAGAQKLFEKRLFQLLNFYSNKSPIKNLAASGGCFMNSLANGKLISSTDFRNFFVPYAAADNGGAMGAALYIWHKFHKNTYIPTKTLPTPFLGPFNEKCEIEKTLVSYKIPFRISENPSKEGAKYIENGSLLGWFQGRMEFGERALGNRSILADPRVAKIKDILNSAVKYRESFRPFAPSVLIEHFSDWFEVPENDTIPYMEKVYKIKPDKRLHIPSVVHKDGTGRLQTVSRDFNPRFYDLIKNFFEFTGVPLVINTSFNVQGEPIVCSHSDAIRTFFSSGLDVLIIEDFVIEKK